MKLCESSVLMGDKILLKTCRIFVLIWCIFSPCVVILFRFFRIMLQETNWHFFNFCFLKPGLGRAYALAFAERGASVVGKFYRNLIKTLTFTFCHSWHSAVHALCDSRLSYRVVFCFISCCLDSKGYYFWWNKLSEFVQGLIFAGEPIWIR